jgi:hypothetical protein
VTGGIHLAFAGAWCAVLVLYLSRLHASGGDRLGMVQGAYDPKELVPFGYDLWNPLMWGFAVVAVLFGLGFLASPALLSVSVPLLVTGRRFTVRAGGRLVWWCLLVAALTAVALPVAMFTPIGQDVAVWWAD